MNDPRPALRTALAQWIGVRARVRALAARLGASQHVLQRDARRSDDPAMLTLVAELAAERDAVATLAVQLDDRIAQVSAACAQCEASFVATVVADARSGAPRQVMRRSRREEPGGADR